MRTTEPQAELGSLSFRECRDILLLHRGTRKKWYAGMIVLRDMEYEIWNHLREELNIEDE